MGKGEEEKDALFFLLFQRLASRKKGKKNGLRKSFLELRQNFLHARFGKIANHRNASYGKKMLIGRGSDTDRVSGNSFMRFHISRIQH